MQAITILGVLANGEFQPSVQDDFFPRPFGTNLSLVPQGKWGEIADGSLESLFWHELTPSNSLVLTWQNALYGRDANAPTNFQAELFGDGSFDYRYPDRTVSYAPVFPFDWDGDGLENSVDPEPRVAGPDAHGTNAEWYRVVCTNVFTDATEIGSDNSDVSPLLPEGIVLREHINPNAYYFVDVVVEQGPSPVYFTGDQAGFVGAPVVVAHAGETNRVPLQVGVEYVVTSVVPFSLILPEGGFAEISHDRPYEKTVKWPIYFSVSTEDGGHTVVVTPYPSDPGGAYDWRNPGWNDAATTFRSLFTTFDERCPYSVNGGRVSFLCGYGSCGCTGCWILGDFVVDGVRCELPTVWCGCVEPEDDDEPPPVFPHEDMASAPSVSATFCQPVVFFEEAYTNAPGRVVPRQAQHTTLRVTAYGGANGARLTLGKIGVDERLVQTGGHRFPSKAVKIPANSDVNYEFIFEGKIESQECNDVKVTATLTAVNAMSPAPVTAELTSVHVSIEAEDNHPDPELLSRHAFGLREKVYLKTKPESACVAWSSGIANCNGGYVDNAGRFLRCPWVAGTFALVVESDGVEFETSARVYEPTVVCRSAMWRSQLPEVSGVAGMVGMSLALYLQPDTVSFSNILMGEIPVRALDAIPPTGYFALMPGVLYATHDTAAGAGVWRIPWFRNGGVYWTDDMAQCPRECPPLPGTDPPAWMNGTMRWNIPVGWGWQDMDRFRLEGQVTPEPTEQVYEIDGDGKLSIRKYEHTIMRDVSGRIWLDGSRVNAWWSGWF